MVMVITSLPPFFFKVMNEGKLNTGNTILTTFHGKGALRVIKWKDVKVSLAWEN
jgi:hypothetical protein